MKRTILLLLLLVLLPLCGCLITEDIIPDTMTLTGPTSCYPPCLVTFDARGVTGGQYTFTIEGETITQASNTLVVRLENLPSLDEPLVATVRWTDGTDTQTAKWTIALKNSGPVAGRPTFNGLYSDQFHSLVQYWRYIVEFPEAYDPEGGHVYLVHAEIWSEEWDRPLAIFCPPYEGTNPPKPGAYHVKTSLEMVDEAFAFYGYWGEALAPVTNMFIAPMQGEPTYPKVSFCLNPVSPSPFTREYWPLKSLPAGDLVLRTTHEDEKGQQTKTESRIPIAPFSRCNVQTPSSVL